MSVSRLAGNFKPRLPQLRKLEGAYQTEPAPLYVMYKNSGSKLKFSSWLGKNGIDAGTRIGKQLMISGPSINFRVTCRYKDILRCSKMHKKMYFDSCLADGKFNAGAKYGYCRDVVNLGMLYVPDQAGHVKSRAFFLYIPRDEVNELFDDMFLTTREMKSEWWSSNKDIIIPLRFYGDDNLSSCFDRMVEVNEGLVIVGETWQLTTQRGVSPMMSDRHRFFAVDNWLRPYYDPQFDYYAVD